MDNLLETIASGGHVFVANSDHLPVGKIDIVIHANGAWSYQGSRFERAKMVQLLSRYLVKNEDSYFLLAPEQRLKITVEDLPFTIQTVDRVVNDGQQKIIMHSNCGEQFELGSKHSLQLLPMLAAKELLPALHIRNGLFARVVRSAYYHLLEWAVEVDAGNGKKALAIQLENNHYILGYL